MRSIPQKEQITSTLNKVAVILDNIDKLRGMLDNKLATKFSVFQVLGGLSETEMSKILVHLLDPRGSHSQGDKFLKLFLKNLLKIRQDNLNNVPQSPSSGNALQSSPPKVEINDAIFCNVKIRREEHTSEGRSIDLTIRSGEYIIGIENKLWAAEQGDQLKDYSEYLKSQCDKDHEAILVFLCVERNRKPLSIKDVDAHVKAGDLVIMNYEDDIIPWLRDCAQVSESEKIRWYIEEIVYWVNKYCYWGEDFMNDKNMLWDMVKDSESELNAMLYVQNHMDEVKRNFIEEYLEYIGEELRLKLENTKWKVSPNVSTKPGQQSWSKRYHKPIIVNRADIAIRAMMEFEDPYYGRPYYGINTDIGPELGFLANLRDALAKLNLEQCSSSTSWPIVVHFERTNWMLPDFIIRLHDFHKNRENSELGRVANTVVANMLDMMKTVDAVVLSQK